MTAAESGRRSMTVAVRRGASQRLPAGSTGMTEKKTRDAQTVLPPRGAFARHLPGRCEAPRCTGRQLVLLRQSASGSAAEILRRSAGMRVALSSDFAGAVRQGHLAPGEGVVFERLGAALLLADPDQARALSRAPG